MYTTTATEKPARKAKKSARQRDLEACRDDVRPKLALARSGVEDAIVRLQVLSTDLLHASRYLRESGDASDLRMVDMRRHVEGGLYNLLAMAAALAP